MEKIGTGILETTAKRTFATYKITIDGRQATLDAEIPEGHQETRIYRNPVALIGDMTIPSASLVRFGKVKPFIDWIYASFENHLSGRDYPSVPRFVKTLDGSLKDTASSDYMHIVNKIGRGEKSSRRELVHAALERFQDELGLSLPQGFYLWTERMKRHYRQRKALGTAPGFFFGREEDNTFNQQVLDDIKRAIDSRRDLSKEYKDLIRVYARMTDKPSGNTYSLFPQAEVPDQEFFKELSAERGDDIPEGLGKAFAEAVRSGIVDLAPKPTSGLFTRQLFELSPLVRMDTDEFKKYFPGERYKDLMENEFISQWAATRHTHVGSINHNMRLASCVVRESPIMLSPKVRVEPFFTIYERMADSLGFLEDVVKSEIPHILEKPRLLANGELTDTLVGDEFQRLRELLSGFGLLARDSLHVPYDATENNIADRKTAQTWIKNMREDPDINRDMPMFVPIIREADGKRFVCYVNPGFRLVTLDMEYNQEPQVTVEKKGKSDMDSFASDPRVEFQKQRVEIPSLVHKEVRIPANKLINDEGLREILPEGDFTEEELDQALAGL